MREKYHKEVPLWEGVDCEDKKVDLTLPSGFMKKLDSPDAWDRIGRALENGLKAGLVIAIAVAGMELIRTFMGMSDGKRD